MSKPISYLRSMARLNSSLCPPSSRRACYWRLAVRTPALLVAVGLLAVGAFSPRAEAVTDATLQIGSTNVTIGASFTVPLTIAVGPNVLGSYNINVGYDTNLLRCTGASGGDTSEYSVTPTWGTNTLGTVIIHGECPTCSTTPTGLVSVAKVSFLSLGPTGSSPLTLSSPDVVDGGLNNLTTSTIDGSVTILAPLTCAVTPTNAAICAGSSQIFVATPSGGLAPYTYNWIGGPSTQSNTVSSTGTYTCTIHDSNSSSATGSVHLTVNPLPTQSNVTGGGAYCAGGSGVVVGLSSSQSGVNYQLYTNSTYAVGSAVAGTGSALSFGSQTGAGTYTAVASNTTSGCTQPMSGSPTVTVAALPAQYNVTGGGVYCAGGSGVAVGLSSSQSGVNYQLYTNSTFAVGSAVAGTGSALSFGSQTGVGTYTAIASNTTSGCTQPMSGSQTVTVNPPSVGGTATASASPICSGSGTTITLTGYTGSIQWQSSTDNVTFNDVGGQTAATLTTGALGVTTHYRARVTSGACSAATSTVAHVTINQTPAAPTAGNNNNGLVCLGSTLNLTASTVSGATYNWSGPNSFSSTQQNPSISNATLAASGTYYVTATVSNCTSVAGSTVVTVNPTSVGGTATPTVSSLCSGSGTTIKLTNFVGTIQWQSSTNSVLFSDVSGQTAATLNTGALGVTTYFRARVTSGACSVTNSSVATVTITGTVSPSVTTVADVGSNICAGTLVTFAATPVNGGESPAFVWKKNSSVVGGSGNTYSDSTLANGDRIDCQLTSSLTCASPATATATTIIMTVHPLPAAPTVGNNGPLCVGATLNLTASTVGNATYSWTGPNGFTSTQQNPTITNVTTAASGLYSVIATASSCISTAGTAIVTVNPAAVGGTATPVDSAVCNASGTTISLAGQTGAIVKWQSSTNNAIWLDLASTNNPYATGNLAATTYFRAVIQSGVCSLTNSTTAQVTVSGVVTPAVTVAADPGNPICAGTAVTFTATPVSGGSAPVYVWKKNGSVVGGGGNSYTDGSLATGDKIDCQLTSSIGCASPSTATAATITLTVNAIPAAPTAGNNGPFCAGSTLNLTASTVAGATYSWTGPNGFTSSQQNPSLSNATATASGLYSVTVRVNGCPSAAGTTTASVLTDTTLPVIHTCAAAVTNTANASGQASVPDLTAGVQATDNCTPVGLLVVTQLPSAGTVVGVGTTPVTLTVRDAAGNPATCDTAFTVLPAVPPVITTAPAVTNAFLQYGTRTVLVAGDTNIFVVGATGPAGVELNYQWQFGDGVTNEVSALNSATHVYSDTNCGPYIASVTVNAGVAAVSSNLTVIVACDFLAITKLQAGLNFAKTNADTVSLKVKLNLGGITNVIQLTGKPVIVDIGDAPVSFTLDKKGHGAGPNGSCILTYTKATKKAAGYWTATLTLSKGYWRNAWVNYGLDNATHKSPGVPVNLPVVLLVGDEVFAAAPSLHYTATYKKSGTAK